MFNIQKIVFSCILLLCFNKIYADVPPASLYAIAKVTTKDNQVIEGAIVLAVCDDEGIRPNAFFFEDMYSYDNVYAPYVMSNCLQYPYFAFEEQEYRLGGRSFREVLGDNGNIPAPTPKYMKFTAFKNETRFVKQGDTLVSTSSYTHQYILSDYFEVDTSLVYNDFYDTSKKQVKIKMNDIKSIELLESPSQNWIDKVSRFTDAFNIMLSEGPGDGQAPVWYHELKKDEEMMRFYEQLLTIFLRTGF